MYERILVPVDGSATSDAGLAEAVKLARLTGARVQLLHVVDDMPFVLGTDGFGTMSADILGVMKEAGEAVLGRARTLVETSGVPVETVLFDSLEGRLSERVASQALAWNANLIVLGTHGRRGVQRMVLGSGAEQIVRSSPVPVLLVRGPAAD
jgi:nucleotide-binding universal stress UspA family protein